MNVNGFKIGVETMEDGSYAVGLFSTDGYGLCLNPIPLGVMKKNSRII